MSDNFPNISISDAFAPGTRQGTRGSGFATLRETLRTESQLHRKDLHTAFLKSQYQGIQPSTAKGFGGGSRRKRPNWLNNTIGFGEHFIRD